MIIDEVVSRLGSTLYVMRRDTADLALFVFGVRDAALYNYGAILTGESIRCRPSVLRPLRLRIRTGDDRSQCPVRIG
jgi:hypothetical protein